MPKDLKAAMRDATNRVALSDPRPGDLWQEHFMPVLFVIARDGDDVFYTKDFPDNGTIGSSPGYKARRTTVAALKKYLSYNIIPGTWADVERGRAPGAVARLQAELRGEQEKDGIPG